MSITSKHAKSTSTESKVIRSETVVKAVSDVLFTGSRVHLLAEPETPLPAKNIHWNRETSDLQDGEGRVYYDVSWDEIEFADEVEYNFPNE